jgi:class 3 adenylate cyclase
MNARHLLLEDFLPLRLLGRIHGDEGRRPAAVHFPAAVIFIDVSRYTALVEQLARRGREGLEELPRLLSLSYGRCSEYVADLGGEVLYFAGDSLLAYWAAEADQLGSAVRSAVDCAGMICRNGHDRGHRGVTEISPALHIGIGAGRLWAAALGDQPVWNLVAGGEAVTQAAASQAIARSWDYEMSAEAKQALASHPAPADARYGRGIELSSEAPSVDWMAAFLPAQARELLLSSNSRPQRVHSLLAIDTDPSRELHAKLSALNEIRPVSAVFARIVGLNCSDALALPQHQALCGSLQGITRTFGGPPGDLFYDDKGLVFSTTFGARGSFHRDDARRAVDAARTIHQTVDTLGLTSSVGVATGDALFAFVGSERRHQFMAHGAPINRAARLMMATERGVLCDAPTERASRSAFKFEPQGTLQLAGLGDMAAVFRPMEPHAATSVDTFLVGRRSELELLKRTFEEAQTGGKRLFWSS